MDSGPFALSLFAVCALAMIAAAFIGAGTAWLRSRWQNRGKKKRGRPDDAQRLFAAILEQLRDGPITKGELVRRLVALGYLEPVNLDRLDPEQARKLIYPVVLKPEVPIDQGDS